MNQHATTQFTILIIDDVLENLHTLEHMLKDEGYSVRSAISGKLALKTIRKKPPELILLDIMMPDMNGYEVCRRLQSEQDTRDIPVIFLSAREEVDDKVKAFQAGGVDYITKPFEIEEVLARVNVQLTLLQFRQQLQEENTRFRQLEDAALDALIIHEQGKILDMNQAAEEMFGLFREEAQGRSVLEFIPKRWHDMIRAAMQSNTMTLYDAEGQHRDGTIFPVEARGKQITWFGKLVRVASIRNISQYKQLLAHSHELEEENRRLRSGLSQSDHLGVLQGRSPLMQKVYERIIQVASVDETVIIYGETGTGKELAARTIFQLSKTHTNDFVSVNCSAIPEHLFESEFFGHQKGAFTGAIHHAAGYFGQAEGGTLFLDEIGDLPLQMQSKLLRVLQDGVYTPVGSTKPRQADVRIIAATNRELRQMVRQGAVREDFFHRLHVLTLEMPPLRLRKDDIPLLIKHFLLQKTSSNETLSDIPDQMLHQLYGYDWPGNVRELYNEVRRYLTTGEMELGRNASRFPNETPSGNGGSLDLHNAITSLEYAYITQAIHNTGGNLTHAAELLNIDRSGLYKRMKRLNLKHTT